jgi:hypothetical protein
MANDIKCPNCGHVFDVENVIAADIEQKLQEQYKEKLQQSLGKLEDEKKKLEADQVMFEEKKKKENEIFAQKLQQEKIKMEADIQDQLRKSIAGDYENQLRILQDRSAESEEKLKESRKKELDFLKKEQDLKNKEAELELELQKKLQQERTLITEQVRKQELDKNSVKDNEHNLRIRELEKQLEDQKKLADEMKRKAEQGSMQLQGEVQELALEELLRATFPFDLISEVGKGVRWSCEMSTRSTSASAATGTGIGWNRRGPAKLSGDARSPHTGSVRIRTPSISSSTVECPSQVARKPVSGGLAHAGRGSTAGSGAFGTRRGPHKNSPIRGIDPAFRSGSAGYKFLKPSPSHRGDAFIRASR